MNNFVTEDRFDLGNYTRGNNARYVTIGNMQFFFSYRTVIAIKYLNRAGIYVQHGRVNEWGPTTGRHMNDVPGNAKENRLNSEDFLNELNKMFKEVAL